MADLFISYSKQDRAIAQRIVAWLEDRGHSVWWDDALTPSRAWDAEIEREIAAAAAVIVLWSPDAVRSDWVRAEAHYALDHNKLVPVKIAECELPLVFQMRQSIMLPGGEVDAQDPASGKLLEWIAGSISRHKQTSPAPAPPPDTSPPQPPEAAAPANPQVRLRGGGITGRPAAIAAVAFVILAAAALAWWLIAQRSLGKPDLYVDRFAAGQDVPAGFADMLHDELVTGLTGSTRITPIEGDGQDRRDAYLITGRVASSDEDVVFYARLFAPGREAPLLSTRLAGPRQHADAARSIAYDFAEVARCVVTGASWGGQGVRLLPERAIEPWSRYCLQLVNPAATLGGTIAMLEQVVEEAPDFASGWASLSIYESSLAHEPVDDPRAALAASAHAAERALDLDPDNARALMTQAWLALRDEPFRNEGNELARRDLPAALALAERSVAMRPSECYCEFTEYADMLRSIGWAQDARESYRRAAELGPTHARPAIGVATASLLLGEFEPARRQVREVAETYPDGPELDLTRLKLAMAQADFAGAAALVEQMQPFAFSDSLLGVLRARQRGGMAAARAVAEPLAMEVRSKGGEANWVLLDTLAISGHAAEAAQMARRLVDSDGINALWHTYLPPHSELRRTAEFEAIVRETGLFDHWARSGKPPAFCAMPAAPGWCRSF